MVISVTHEISFLIEYYEPTEGGMQNEAFSDEVQTIEEAVSTLEIAKKTKPERDWIITARVETAINGKKK